MGLVMKSIQPKIAGRADGGLVSSLVKDALNAKCNSLINKGMK
jgi:uncharacterized protein YqeY